MSSDSQLEHRSADVGAAVIDQMMALPSLLFPAVEEVLADISAADPDVAPLLTATHSASDLRLHGGLIISKFAGPMVRGERITLRDVGLIRIEQGQVIELHRLLLASISLANVGDQTRDVVDGDGAALFRCGAATDRQADRGCPRQRPVLHDAGATFDRVRTVTAELVARARPVVRLDAPGAARPTRRRDCTGWRRRRRPVAPCCWPCWRRC